MAKTTTKQTKPVQCPACGQRRTMRDLGDEDRQVQCRCGMVFIPETGPGKPANSEPTAAKAYATRRSDIARLLDVLDMELAKHDERAKAEPTNWGLTGNLGNVRSGLIGLVGFLANMDPEEVERFLAE